MASKETKVTKGQAFVIRRIVEFIGQNHEPCPSPICGEYGIHTVPVLDFIHEEFDISKETLGKWAGEKT